MKTLNVDDLLATGQMTVVSSDLPVKEQQEYIFPAVPAVALTPTQCWRLCCSMDTTEEEINRAKQFWSRFIPFPVITIIYTANKVWPMWASVTPWADGNGMRVLINHYYGSLDKLARMATGSAPLPEPMVCLNLKDGSTFLVVTGDVIKTALDWPVYRVV